MGVRTSAYANRLNFGTPSHLTITTAMTACAWVTFDNITQDHYIAGRYYATDPYRCWTFGIRTTGKVTGIVSANGITTTIINSTNAITHTALNHIVFRYSGSNLDLFVNGVSAATSVAFSSGINVAASISTLIGTQTSSSDAYALNGSVFDFRLYNRSLSNDECADLYAQKGQDAILDSALVLRTCVQNGYAGDSLSGQTVYDHSIYKNHITATGAPTVEADPYSTVKPPIRIRSS